MMSICKITGLCVAAMCGLAADAKGEPTALDIFNQLTLAPKSVAMAPAARAAALPAAAYLPGNADAALGIVQPGQGALKALQLLGKPLCPEMEKALGSIGSVVVSGGSGSAAAFARALPLLTRASQIESLEQWAKGWSHNARPAFAAAIREAFDTQIQQQRAGMLEALAHFHISPMYAALTPLPGRESDFQKLHTCLTRAMQGISERCPEWQAESGSGYTGLRTTQLRALKMLTGSEPQNEDVRRALAQRELHLLTKMQDGALLLILCERPGEINLPGSAEYSLLNSPILNGADAHINHLLATAWVSPAFFQTMQDCLYRDKQPLANAIAEAFRKIGQLDPVHQNTYLNATRDVMQLDAQTPRLRQIRVPFTMQVWQQGNEVVGVETAGDAQGARFEPGKLRLVDLATAPDMIFYAESTAFSAPCFSSCRGSWPAMLGISRAIFLSLEESRREMVFPYLRYIEQFAPEVQTAESALHTIFGGLSAPVALYIGGGTQGEDPAVALGAAVIDRAGLVQGQQQLVSALAQAAAKCGIPPSLVTMLPVESQALGNNAIQHVLRLPFLPQGVQPSLAVSDSYMALGYSPSLNARMLASATAQAPFCGAVCSVSFPGWAATARKMTDRAGATGGTAVDITRFLERLAAKAKLYMHSSVIRNDTLMGRGILLLAPAGGQQAE